MFHCLPDELRARFDALGSGRGRRALVELLAYYAIQHEDKQRRQWEEGIERVRSKRNER